jgi:hypothetical protein
MESGGAGWLGLEEGAELGALAYPFKKKKKFLKEECVTQREEVWEGDWGLRFRSGNVLHANDPHVTHLAF